MKDEVTVWPPLDVPAFVVHLTVVGGTQKHQVVDLGGAAVAPIADGLCPAWAASSVARAGPDPEADAAPVGDAAEDAVAEDTTPSASAEA